MMTAAILALAVASPAPAVGATAGCGGAASSEKSTAASLEERITLRLEKADNFPFQRVEILRPRRQLQSQRDRQQQNQKYFRPG